MKLIHLLRDLQIGLQAETGDDQPVLSIKVSHAVWHKIVTEVHSSRLLWDGSFDSSPTATQFEIMGIEITK